MRLGFAEVEQITDYINPVERSLLEDMLALYGDDLTRERHLVHHDRCLVCAKEQLIVSILQYQKLDASLRQSANLPDLQSPSNSP